MIKLVDLTFQYNHEFATPADLIRSQQTSLEYLNHLETDILPIVIKHTSFKAGYTHHHVPYYFEKGSNSFFHFPLPAILLLRKISPDIVIVQGMTFPWQVILLRLFIRRHARVIVQHHGERPFGKIKRWLQQIADKCIDAYLFTAHGNALEWINAGIIGSPAHCFEVLEASTYLKKANKEESREKTGMHGGWHFLWVGRLNRNKDPLTVLKAFKQLVETQKDAHLHMVYQSEELFNSIREMLASDTQLNAAVHLIGAISHDDLATWYSAADFYISASHSEGSGYALIEAMSCGCIPVVTDIPSFRKITGNGKYGYLYEAGNTTHLLQTLLNLEGLNLKDKSDEIAGYFKTDLSFLKISNDINLIIRSVLQK